MGMASNTIIILLGSLAMLHSLPLLHALPNRSTTVHRILPGGRVKSHGGFLGGYGFKITGLTRSYAEPDFVLRSRQQQPQQQQQQPQESDGLGGGAIIGGSTITDGGGGGEITSGVWGR